MEPTPESFVLAATGGQRTRAEAMLAAGPQIADDPWAALALGRAWEGDPNEPGGPRAWAPLLYVCHSCFPSAAVARQLLARGADPNASFENEYGSMSALYGAAGVAHDPELSGVLLEAGADPNDGESLYHSTESKSTACLELLLAHGAETRGTNALAHALDDERLEHVRLLIEAGADPTEGSLVAHAVRRGRGPATVRLLAEHGADVDRPGGETWRGNVPLRTPYRHARLRARDDVAETLAELGATTEVDPADEAVAAFARGERPSGLPSVYDVDQQEVIVLAALGGHVGVVVDAVGPDFRGVVGGSPEGSLLQHAAWVGDATLVERLLGLGAGAEGALAWAAHGSRNHRVPERDYVAVAELLLAAGSPLEPALLEEADGPLYAWLAARVAQ